MTYATREIETSDPIGRLVRVFDLASTHVSRARAALRAGDMRTKGEQVHRLSRCLQLLQTSLDMDQGAEVAGGLDRIYSYLMARLAQGHLRNDDEVFAEIGKHLAELGSAWREVLERRPAAPAARPAETVVAT